MSIDLIGIGKRHGSARALDGVSITVAEGEFLALIGPSGSGKTTLLRLIAGLERDYEGTIRIAGQDVAPIPARDRRIGFVFQNYALFRHMSAAENIAFGLRVRPRGQRPGEAAIQARVAELLAMVQLDGLGPRYPDQLSGGQRQRVALARALAIEPRVLLLDEPLGALDPPIRQGLRTMLRDLHRRLGLTTVLVTHDRMEAESLADRIAVLRAGRLEQIGSPAELEAAPANAFVFGFLGDAVAFPGTVRTGHFQAGELPFENPSILSDGPAQALLRPDELGLIPGPGPARIAGVLAGARQTRYAVQLGARRFEAILPGPAALAEGEACTPDLAAARILRD